MRNLLYTAAAALLVSLFASCDAHLKYDLKPSDFEHDFFKIGSSHALVRVVPENDQVFYYTGVCTKDQYTPGTDDWRFMYLTIDSLNRAYLDWRAKLLRKGEDYIAPFSSKFLEFGQADLRFVGLEPDTDYYIYSCAVDPKTQAAIGEPKFSAFHTMYPKNSGLAFEIMLQPNGYLLVRPSNQRDQYSFMVLSEEQFYANIINIDWVVVDWALSVTDDYFYKGDITIDIKEYLPTKGTYYICVFGWDGGLTTPVTSMPQEWPVK